MKFSRVIIFIIAGLFILAGCSEKDKDAASDATTERTNSEEQKKEEDAKFKPGTFKPGTFTPGEFKPGTFKPGTFKPGTFTPGNFDPSVTVSVEEDEIVIDIPSHLLFDFDKSTLKTDVIETLEQLSEDLNEYEGANLLINGHTDNQGEPEYNQRLSEERAKEVQHYLEKLVNVEKIKIITKGYGSTKPVSSNETEAGKEKNRRVEIIVEPLENK
ncbi:OmpA family protein [Cytobacillus sp. FJAT-53684]|uniref:OmpA family protein n=1 Tax=Cytobacillus mangrovibacter TaxID=3299024 RepID=A0ABW6K2W2_9BACI